MRVPLALSAVSLTLAAAAWLREPPPTSSTPPGRGDARMERQIDDLRAEIDALWEAQAEAPLAEAPREEPPGNASEETAVNAEVLDAGDPEEDPGPARLAALGGALAEEPADVAWSGAAEGALRERLGGKAFGDMELRDLRCGSVLCRIEVDVDGVSSDMSIHTRLGAAIPWPGNAFMYVEGDHPATAVVFVAREGAALPG